MYPYLKKLAQESTHDTAIIVKDIIICCQRKLTKVEYLTLLGIIFNKMK